MSGDNEAKEGAGCNINEKYKRLMSKQIGETERILGVELKEKENVTRIVTRGPNEDETTRDKDCEKIKLCNRG